MADIERTLDTTTIVLQSFWPDLVRSVLHDSFGNFTWGWDYDHAKDTKDQEIRFRGEDYFMKVRRSFDDRDLLAYVSLSADVLPLSHWRSHSLCDQIVRLHNKYLTFGYRIQLSNLCEDRVIHCPAFIACAILAALYFRIPSGSKDNPQLLSLSCSLVSHSSMPPQLNLSLETPEPLSPEILKWIQIDKKDSIWDRWHHSWGFARRWASRYSGNCYGQIPHDGRFRVSLELPTE